MTDLNKLADLIESRIGVSFDGECHLVEEEAREAASALRDAGKMREALEGFVEDGEFEKRATSADDFDRGVRAARLAAADTARLALKTEGE